MQIHHHPLHQQFAALLSAALAQKSSSSSAADTASLIPTSSSAPEGSAERPEDAARVAALDSLHRIIVYPSNSLLLPPSAPFLAQGLSQLLSDKSYAVRRAAVVAYGALCAVLNSALLSAGGLQSHALTAGLPEGFVAWALPLLGVAGVANGSIELALQGLREFLSIGDAAAAERFVLPILRACQDLLEDERTSLSLLRRLLGLLTLISLRFGRCFQPHFADIVDLLLGWAFVPNLSDSDRRTIMDSFLQFRMHWLNNLQFSVGLLWKFLGNMEVLMHDASVEAGHSLNRLLALFSCFSTVLQVIASGVPESNKPEQISGPLEDMGSRVVRCISMFGAKSGSSKWMGESWRCLVILAEVLREKFAKFYELAVEMLFPSLIGVSSLQLQAVLKTNVQLLSLQNTALLPSSVRVLLKFNSPLSQLRLHPNHHVVASSAAIYLFFVQHRSDDVVSQVIASLFEELNLLEGMVGKLQVVCNALPGTSLESTSGHQLKSDMGPDLVYSEHELLSLLRFDLKILLTSVSFGAGESSADQMTVDTFINERATRITSFVLEKLDPFRAPFQCSHELQFHIFRTLHKLSEAELLSKFKIFKASFQGDSSKGGQNQVNIEVESAYYDLKIHYIKKYGMSIVHALHASSSTSLKVEALDWICTVASLILNMEMDANESTDFCASHGISSIGSGILSAVLDSAYDREPKVRSRVASSLEMLFLARLIDPANYMLVAKVALDKLGDPDMTVRNAFVRVISIALPAMVYMCGLLEDRGGLCTLLSTSAMSKPYKNWQHVLALSQLPRKFHSQQLVSVLSFISCRSKAPLSSWVQRLVFCCRGKSDMFSSQQYVTGDDVADDIPKDSQADGAVLDRICPVNNLAAVWWSIHEAARHCIFFRLRTNLGGPTQTFAALERMLLDVPSMLAPESRQSDSKYVGSSDVGLVPIRLLLDFVEALKKNIYNSYEGSVVLPCSSKQSSLFFRANKKVCEEWFSRICEPMRNAALALHYSDAAIHYCALRLLDLKNLVMSSLKDRMRGGAASESFYALRDRLEADVLKVLRHAALALCRCHETDALVGLHKWAALTFYSSFKDDKQLTWGESSGLEHFSWMLGLVYQAQGQYEKAAAHYSHLLQSEEALGIMGADGIQYVIERVIECYTSLSDWKCLEGWLTELQTLRAIHAGKPYAGALTAAGNELNAIHALACFDSGDFHSAWGYLDLTPKSSCELTLDPKVALERSEQMLLRSMLQSKGRFDGVQQELVRSKLMLDEALMAAPLDGLSEAAAYATQLHCIFALEEGLNCDGKDDHQMRLSMALHPVLQNPVKRTHQDCSMWIKVFRVYRTLQPSSLVTLSLCKKLCSLARKQNNLVLANRMNQYLIDHPLRCSEEMYKELFALNVQYECILLKYAEGKYDEALTDLWSLVRTSLLPTTASNSSNTGALLKAKACLKLSSWLVKQSSSAFLANILLNICKDYRACDELKHGTDRIWPGDGSTISEFNSHAVLQEIVGTATKISCNLCPTMGKAWHSYASWCFVHAKSSFSTPTSAVRQSYCLSPALQEEISPDQYQLRDDEKAQVKSVIRKLYHAGSTCTERLKPNSWPENESLIDAMVEQTILLIQTAAGAPGSEFGDLDSPAAVVSSQLQGLFHANAFMQNTDMSSLVDELIDIWQSLRHRRVSLFGHAAHGYFKFLSHSSPLLQSSHNGDILRGKTRSRTLRALLYVLYMILNYGVELRETLESGLSSVPLLPWQEVIPQLFARLSSHPEKTVRKQLEGLLMMLGKLSPYSIVYPTLVDINAYEGDPSEELQCILDFLVKLYPKLIQDVKLAIDELGMITVLWEEQWMSTLQDLHSDVMKRINMLKEEATRVAVNSTLSLAEKNKINAAKYSAMMAPVVVALERRLASTSREPRTPHELWFHSEYGEQLKSAILSLKTPHGSAAGLGDVWRPFDAIAASLATHHRKSLISLSEVAPQLALLSTSDIPMPGFEKQMSVLDSSPASVTGTCGIVTISSFCEQLTILSTKTRPKKLVLQGSDGQKYTYLLKGREDLRLDARIMQLLEALNSLFCSSSDTNGRPLAIRYYSVTPISGRAGLIQWVDNVSSIYSVYKSWQKRSQVAQYSVAGAGNIDAMPPIPRPNDMFYGKIIPALKEKGIKRVISRRDWPHDVKRKVLLELIKETPRQLLWQEMWCASEGFKSFNLKIKRFSGSVAAMSMVGHILGLGDRHLDNILMDFSSGDVVHIDYNVCFDKGKRLKIPEIVPFRLTHTIETALGLTGIEGAFRANCEAVMSVLLENEDILLMLLEVFVWDPLMEWTRGNSQDEAGIAGEEKKGMELAVSLSLFSSRVQEIRVPLQEHHDLLITTLPAAESVLKRLLDVLNQYEVISAIFYHADKERSNLFQHEATAKSIVAEATSISEKAQASFELHAYELEQAKTVAADKAHELAAWLDQHERVLAALQDGSVPGVQSSTGLSSMEEALSLTSAVLVAGIPLTIVPEPTKAQCSELDKEVSHVIKELDGGLSAAVEALKEYSLVLQRVVPENYITTSPVSGWAQILQLSVNNLSIEMLSLAKRQAADLIAKAQGEGFDLAQERHRDLIHKMETYITDLVKLDYECNELVNSIGSDNEAQSRERLLSAFVKHVESSCPTSNENDVFISHPVRIRDGGLRSLKARGDLKETRTKVLSFLGVAVSEIYRDVRSKLVDYSNKPIAVVGSRTGNNSLPLDVGTSFHEFEEHVEKCVLVSAFVHEVQEAIGIGLPINTADIMQNNVSWHWASIFQAILHSSIHLIEQIIEVILPELISSIVSCNSEVMEAFGSLSQIQGSVDSALEKLVEVELERASLMELEQNYFVKVGLITEQQLALEEAATRGRDHLSWEEAEEIASQEEACRAQLDQLHQTWSQKDLRISSLMKIEASVMNSLASSEQYFSSLVSTEVEGDLHMRRSTVFLSTLNKPFCELESIDDTLSSYYTLPSNYIRSSLADLVSSGSLLSELVWALTSLRKNHAFFVWKVGLIDSVLDFCMHEISSSADLNFGFDQLYISLKKKLAVHLQQHVCQYLKERIAPSLVFRLDEEIDKMQHVSEGREEIASDSVKGDGADRRVVIMLEEYCNAHETARAARSAVSLMKRQVNELTEVLGKAILETVQLEWLHDLSVPYVLKNEVLLQHVSVNDTLFSLILNIGRRNLLEKMQSSISAIARSVECLRECEKTSVPAEGQLERAMAWACAGPNTVAPGNSAKSSGIPSEFHDHLLRRKQLLWAAQEHASDILRICTSVMDFEASRDGIFFVSGDKSSVRTIENIRAWQQALLNSLTRLDAGYHSFTRAEQEWKLAQHNMETATNGLFSATNQLSIASLKAKSALVDLQETLVAMHERASEASAALSSYSHVSKGHTALTSECGSLIEEVLAITEGLHDVYNLGKEAAATHGSLMANLSKANTILLPLDASLSADLAALADAMSKEREINNKMSLIHGKAIYQSYILRLRETCQALPSMVLSLTQYVKELHSMLIKLGRISSLHAGNLHKALEGLGDSQVVRSQDISLSSSEILHSAGLMDKGKASSQSLESSTQIVTTIAELSLQDEGWISPPVLTYTSSSATGAALTELSSPGASEKEFFHDEAAGKDTASVSLKYTDELGNAFTENLDSKFQGNDSAIMITAETPCLSENGQGSILLNEATVADAAYVQEMDVTLKEANFLSRKNEEASLKQARGQGESGDDPKAFPDSTSRGTRGKNAFALSVLKQVEQKLHGRDIDGTRPLKISELVDYLLKQATSIENLCNMYEGWTPWI